MLSWDITGHVWIQGFFLNAKIQLLLKIIILMGRMVGRSPATFESQGEQHHWLIAWWCPRVGLNQCVKSLFFNSMWQTNLLWNWEYKVGPYYYVLTLSNQVYVMADGALATDNCHQVINNYEMVRLSDYCSLSYWISTASIVSDKVEGCYQM